MYLRKRVTKSQISRSWPHEMSALCVFYQGEVMPGIFCLNQHAQDDKMFLIGTC